MFFDVDKKYPIVLDILDKYALELRGRITQVTGFSGSGKTLLCNTILDIKSDMKYNEGQYPDYFKDIEVFDYMQNFRGISDLQGLYGKLILIDRADDIVTAEALLSYILDDKENSYLLFARGCLELGLSPNYICELIRIDRKIVTKYKFSEKGWF